MGNLGATELLIVLGVILLLFGSHRLPGLARSLGQSLRILKHESRGEKHETPAAPDEHSPRTG